jgi:hypothetical protein
VAFSEGFGGTNWFLVWPAVNFFACWRWQQRCNVYLTSVSLSVRTSV